MNWDAWDYVAASTLVGGAALSVFAAARLIRHQNIRRFAMVGLPLLFGLVWLELAVGI